MKISMFALLMVGAMVILASKSWSTEPSPLHSVSANTKKGTFEWQVELASDQPSRETGLMNRPSMKPFHGMLFRFEETRPIAMWMKNTLISLDMIFASATGKITHIHRSAVPHSLEVIHSNGPVRYVLEVNAGEVDRAGLQVGGVLKHPWFLPEN